MNTKTLLVLLALVTVVFAWSEYGAYVAGRTVTEIGVVYVVGFGVYTLVNWLR